MIDMSYPQNYRRALASRPEPPVTALPADDVPVSERRSPLDLVRIEVEPGMATNGNLGPVEVFERFTARVDELGAAIVGMADRLRASLKANREHDPPPEATCRPECAGRSAKRTPVLPLDAARNATPAWNGLERPW